MSRWLVISFCLLCLISCRENKDISSEKNKHNTKGLEKKQLLKKCLGDLVFVKGGTFVMGDSGDPENGLRWSLGTDNIPAHKVTLDSYYIGKYEVTYGEHDIFTADTDRPPSLKKLEKLNIRTPEVSAGVSWFDAKGYCAWLEEETGMPFDLPTEAQWEYAARSKGQNIPYATDTGFLDVGRNVHESIDDALAPGTFPPNPLGIYDMSGNVIEWVNDWFDAEYYKNSPAQNPLGPESGTVKVRRGGSFLESPTGWNVYTRQELAPSVIYENVGFRCALNSSDPPEALKQKLEQTLAQKAK